MGRSPKVDYIRTDFIKSLSSANDLRNDVQQVAAIRANPGHPTLHVKQVRRVVELAFMGMMAAWEDFLEQTMVRYMAGANTNSGYAPRLRLDACESLEHAYQVYSGNPTFDPTRQYLDWREPTTVVNRAKTFLYQGHPYNAPLTQYADRLKDAVKVRDRVAHASKKAIEEFNAVARRLRGAPLHQGYRVGDLLLSPATAHFGHNASTNGWTVFEAYRRIFEDCARRIVP